MTSIIISSNTPQCTNDIKYRKKYRDVEIHPNQEEQNLRNFSKVYFLSKKQNTMNAQMTQKNRTYKQVRIYIQMTDQDLKTIQILLTLKT